MHRQQTSNHINQIAVSLSLENRYMGQISELNCRKSGKGYLPNLNNMLQVIIKLIIRCQD